jgi:hypothetical protein
MSINLCVKYRYPWPIVMKFEFARQIFGKIQISNFVKIRPVEARVVPCGRTDGRTDLTELVVAFRNFVRLPKMLQLDYFARDMPRGGIVVYLPHLYCTMQPMC